MSEKIKLPWNNSISDFNEQKLLKTVNQAWQKTMHLQYIVKNINFTSQVKNMYETIMKSKNKILE